MGEASVGSVARQCFDHVFNGEGGEKEYNSRGSLTCRPAAAIPALVLSAKTPTQRQPKDSQLLA